MKKNCTISIYKTILGNTFTAVVLVIIMLFSVRVNAQADSVKAKETPTMLSPSFELLTVQKTDGSIDLKAAIKAKVKGTFIKLPLLKVKFLLITDTTEKELGFLITDRNGKAVFTCKPGSVEAGKEGSLHFKAVYAGNKSIEAADAEVTVKRGKLEISPVKDDSLFKVRVKFTDLSGGPDSIAANTTVSVFVQRSFNPLKLGEGTTDESGEAIIEIPAKLPGDAKGNITLLARIDENENYGNLEAALAQPWGVRVSDKLQDMPRALWSAHPPLWMLITFIILVGTVWGHYIVIIYELFRLRKEEPHTTATHS
jgi:hypothetical protein